MNSFGRLFRVELFGESHGPALGCLVDGCPCGLPLAAEDFEADLARRRAGASGTTPRREADLPELASGVYEGRTSGAPLCVLFRNGDARSGDYELFARVPRPGHADFTASAKYRGFNDPRGSGHFSGRLTLPLVAAGVVAKKLLPALRFETRLVEAGGREDAAAAIAEAAAAGDSVGGLVEIRVEGLGAGLGEPFFDSLEGLVAHAAFAVPGVRGIEFGDGFRAAAMRGSEHNDRFVGAYGLTATNHAGGVNGGISNGSPLVLRVAMKPTSTIAASQATFDLASGAMTELSAPGRHDACIALRGAVALEAAVAVALADLSLIARSQEGSA
ncbi:MAG TPA: chorismate synthase [Spirochaetia bacterium]|nr:chorismate synthase [Spirochaetia bacterium]HRZ65961.1 chorismate synthase [Spirochaetia bacterium]